MDFHFGDVDSRAIFLVILMFCGVDSFCTQSIPLNAISNPVAATPSPQDTYGED